MIRSPVLVGVLLFLGSSIVGIMCGGPVLIPLLFPYLPGGGRLEIHPALICVAVVQLFAIALVIFGILRRVFGRADFADSSPTPHRAWKHFLVAALLAFTAVFWGKQFHVWTSTKLDLWGVTAYGESKAIRDYTVRYKFTTEDGQTVRAIRSHQPNGTVFVYLRENPSVFKVKGSGQRAQVAFLAFAALAIWQSVAGVRVVRRNQRGKTVDTREGKR